MGKQNWFETLNEALVAEDILEYWDCLFSSISYGETRSWTFDRDGRAYYASIYRESDGRYERPLVYTY